jgi:hypothetical protein
LPVLVGAAQAAATVIGAEYSLTQETVVAPAARNPPRVTAGATVGIAGPDGPGCMISLLQVASFFRLF